MNDLALSRTQPTTLSREQRITNAKRVIGSRISATEASKAAKKLAGQFASLRAHDPDGFIWAVAATLAKYPQEVVAECCDPQHGLAREVEFLSVKSLAEWCERELALYIKMAEALPSLPSHAEPVLSDEHRATMRERVMGLLTGIVSTIRDRQVAYRAGLAERISGPVRKWDGTITPALAERIRKGDGA